MKAINFLALAALAAAPTLALAQTTQGLTRSEVRAELAQLEKAGYDAASDNTQYPANLEAALARIHAGEAAAPSGYGGVASGASHSGDHRGAPRDASTSQLDTPDLASLYSRP